LYQYPHIGLYLLYNKYIKNPNNHNNN
jgi:hypothetical protein